MNLLIILSVLFLIEQSSSYSIDFSNGKNRLQYEANVVDSNGRVINEPKLNEAITSLSGVRFLNNKQHHKKKSPFKENYGSQDRPSNYDMNMMNQQYHDMEPSLEQGFRLLNAKRNQNLRYQQPSPYQQQQQYPIEQPKKKSDVKIDYNENEMPRIFITNVNKNININDLEETDIEDPEVDKYKKERYGGEKEKYEKSYRLMSKNTKEKEPDESEGTVKLSNKKAKVEDEKVTNESSVKIDNKPKKEHLFQLRQRSRPSTISTTASADHSTSSTSSISSSTVESSADKNHE